MSRANQRATLPAGWKWLSTPNSAPRAANATATTSSDQPGRGALPGLIINSSLWSSDMEVLTITSFTGGRIHANRPEIVTDNHPAHTGRRRTGGEALQPADSNRHATTL